MKNASKWLINLWGRKNAIKVGVAWQSVFNLKDENIKLILKDLAVYCNVYKTSFVNNDPNLTSFNEGARDVFLHILEMANLSQEEILNLISKDE